MEITIREAKVKDAKRLLDIYAYYVENTAIFMPTKKSVQEIYACAIENWYIVL